MTYGRDLCQEGVLGLNYADVVAMLFSLFSHLLGLYSRFLHLGLCFFGLILKPLGFFQFFLERCQLFPGGSQLISGLAQAFPLVLGLPLHAIQGQVSTTASILLLGQLFLQFSIAIFSNGKHLHSYGPSFSFIFQLLVAQIGNFLKPESGLDSLKEKG